MIEKFFQAFRIAEANIDFLSHEKHDFAKLKAP